MVVCEELSESMLKHTETVLKMKMSQFYKQLFCYLCNFKHPRKGFDLLNKQEQIFIELKTNFLSNNHNARNSKFHHLEKYKTNNLNANVYYICLNDKCQLHVNYMHHFGFQIMTGTEA